MAEELDQILPVLLQAQGDQDYILQADILEGDLLPLLQRFQMKLQESGMAELPDFFESNMLMLKEIDYELFTRLQTEEEMVPQYIITLAINGQPIARKVNGGREFYLHSTVNPEWEARLLVESLPVAENYVVLGMGLGYHVIELLKKYPESRVTVLESENYLLLQAFQYADWTKYLQENRVKMVS